MKTSHEIKNNILSTKNNIEATKVKLKKKRKEFIDTETDLIGLKEELRKLEEELYIFETTDPTDFSEDDVRDQQIEDYKSRMEESLKKIQDEAPLKYLEVGDIVND